MNFGKILVVEDTQSLLTLYRATLVNSGFNVSDAATFSAATARILEEKPDLIVLDLALPDGRGMDLMELAKTENPFAKVIVVTANASVDQAVDAMRNGAFDFLIKPVTPQALMDAVINARSDAPRARVSNAETEPLGGFIGSSRTMQTVYATIRSAARSNATVFVDGESGTGKKLCAEAIHALSARQDGRFIQINCGAVTLDRLESILFSKADASEASAQSLHGTLYFDEICELSAPAQACLLRYMQVIEQSALEPEAAARSHSRIVCASSRDALTQVRNGAFREDLYYRLHVVPIHLPPLRERGQDVIEIAEAMLSRFAKREGRVFTGLSNDVKKVFLRHEWNGNVRQLQNTLWNIVVLKEGPVVERSDLPPEFFDMQAAHRHDAPETAPALPQMSQWRGMTLAEIERMVVENAIEDQNGSIPRAARSLDVSPSTLYRKLEAWGRPARPRKS